MQFKVLPIKLKDELRIGKKQKERLALYANLVENIFHIVTDFDHLASIISKDFEQLLVARLLPQNSRLMTVLVSHLQSETSVTHDYVW